MLSLSYFFFHQCFQIVYGRPFFLDRLLGEDGGDGIERPMIYWFGSCTHSIRTIPLLMHDENVPEDVDTNGEDHAADTARYACMSRPYTRPKPPEAKPMTDLSDVTLNQLWQDQARSGL